MTLAGDVATFDSAAYTSSLAALLSVQPSAISLKTQPASVDVTASISMPTAASAKVLSDTLSAYTPSALSSALSSSALAVTVEATFPPSTAALLVPAPSPPSATPPTATPPTAGGSGAAGGEQEQLVLPVVMESQVTGGQSVQNDSGADGLSGGVIAGVAVGAAVLVLLAALLARRCLCTPSSDCKADCASANTSGDDVESSKRDELITSDAAASSEHASPADVATLGSFSSLTSDAAYLPSLAK